MQNIIEPIRQIGDLYNIENNELKDIVEISFRESILSFYGCDSDVYYDNNNLEVFIYKEPNNAPIKLNLENIPQNFIWVFKKRLLNRLALIKESSLYNAIKHIRGNIIDGYLSEKKDTYYIVTMPNIPQEIVGILRYSDRISNEYPQFNKHYFFSVLKVEIIYFAGKPKLSVFLSRKNKRLVEKLTEKTFYEEEGISLNCKCIRRMPGKYALIKTNMRIPNKVVEYVSQNLNNEKIAIRRKNNAL